MKYVGLAAIALAVSLLLNAILLKFDCDRFLCGYFSGAAAMMVWYIGCFHWNENCTDEKTEA